MKPFLFFALWFFILDSFVLYSQTVVSTQFGQVQGSVNGGVYQFLGIPFAKPPVGNLRWKAPENPDNWSITLITNAFKPACPQKDFKPDGTFTLKGNEDCLYLNIWTPQLGTSANKAVMVFIHGGGNQQGSASDSSGGMPMYFGKNLSQRGDVVVVTIQYRLGPFGFLVHPGLEAENVNNQSGNYGVLDQILALQWVKNNIKNFGGDTTKIMIFGESAGGLNVGNLLVTPLSAGLFHRACIQSAVPAIDDYNIAKNRGIAFVDTFINSGTSTQKIAYMRALPADSLLFMMESPLQGGIVRSDWKPVKDNVVFSEYPLDAIRNGSFHKVPFMIGSNSEEMSLSVPQTVTPAMVTALINAYLSPIHRPQANILYPPGTNNTDAKQSYVAFLTDAQFTSTTRRVAQCVSTNSPEPVWRYFFTFKHTIPQLSSYGAYHGMELFYVFNTWENHNLATGPLFKPADDSVQKSMLTYWTNFAKTGNPNGNGLVNWVQYDTNSDCYLEIQATSNGDSCGIRTIKSNFWDSVINFSPCISTSHANQNSLLDPTVHLYPNPTNNELWIHSDFIIEKVEIFNLYGQLLEIYEMYTHKGLISLVNWDNGTYLLNIKFQNGNYKIVKVIKE